MENQRIYAILNASDGATRQNHFSLLSAEEKLDFGSKIVREILKGRVEFGSQIMANILNDTKNDIKRIFTPNIDGIAQATKLLRSKAFKLHQVMQSLEYQYALEILTNENSPEIFIKKAEELILAMVSAIDFKNLEIGDKLFDQIMHHADLKSQPFARILVTLSHKYIHKLQDKNHMSQRVVPILLNYSKCFKTVRMTLSFWNKIADMKLSPNLSMPIFEVLMINLAESLYSKMMSMEYEDNDVRMKFQSEIIKTVAKVSRHVSADNAFEFFSSILYNPGVSEIKMDVAFLFLEEITPSVTNIHIVNKVLQTILELPENSKYLLPSIKLLSGLSNWLKSREEKIQPVFNFLMKALSCKASIADAAAEVYKKICRDCKNLLTDHFDTFYQIFLNFNIFNMSQDGQQNFIKALCSIVSVLPQDKLIVAMTEICRVQIEKILKSPNPKGPLDLLADIFACIDPQGSKKSTAKVFVEVWPKLSSMMDTAGSADVLRNIMECLKCAVMTNGIELLPILEEIIDKTLQHVNEETCGKALSVFNEIFNSLNGQFANQQMIIFEAAAFITFNVLRSNRSYSSPIVEKFFEFACNVLAKLPDKLMRSPFIIPTVELAIEACSIDTKDSKALKFLERVLTVEAYRGEVLSRYAEEIISVLLRSSMFIFTDMGLTLTTVSKIFVTIKKASNDAFSSVITKKLNELPNGNQAVSIENGNAFLQAISRPGLSPDDIKRDLITLRNLFNSI